MPQRGSGCERGAVEEGGGAGVLARWALWPEARVLPGGLPQTASSRDPSERLPPPKGVPPCPSLVAGTKAGPCGSRGQLRGPPGLRKLLLGSLELLQLCTQQPRRRTPAISVSDSRGSGSSRARWPGLGPLVTGGSFLSTGPPRSGRTGREGRGRTRRGSKGSEGRSPRESLGQFLSCSEPQLPHRKWNEASSHIRTGGLHTDGGGGAQCGPWRGGRM